MSEFLEVDWLEFKNSFQQARSLPEKFHELNVYYMSECYLQGLQPDDKNALKQIIEGKVKLMTETDNEDVRIKMSFLISGLCIGWALQ